ncbi:MAG TPA: MMPL family transporter [Chitinophagaceae bacterium]|nr:MMPL family transporter [Chitinophagaceae bacterium]
MWKQLAHFILRFRAPILIVLFITTLFMGYLGSKVGMKYDTNSAIPSNHPKYIEHQNFKKMFGEDGSMLVVGFEKQDFFEPEFFKKFTEWQRKVKAIPGIENILGIPTAINVIKESGDSVERLTTMPIFRDGVAFDSSVATFLNLPFYRDLLYNPTSHSYLTAIYMNKDVLKTARRIEVVKELKAMTDEFATSVNLKAHYSGLPFIRSEFSESVKYEMRLILIASLVLTAVILFLFFRSLSAVFSSVLIVFAGVCWALGIIALMGYKISILTALVAPLMVVIGIPNCIYFLNKYHTLFEQSGDKQQSLLGMVERMGVVTLFTNLTAAIGFGVFYFTKSEILREFGLVAGLSILVVFFVSLFGLPAIFSYLKAPETKHTQYLENKFLTSVLLKFEFYVVTHPKFVTAFWVLLIGISVIGIFRLKSEGYIVDDLPKNNSIYSDLKYFEKNFHGVMPLEIVIDTKKKNGATSLSSLQKIDELSSALRQYPQMSKPLSIAEAVKFARQAYYDGDSSSFGVPNSFDVAFLLPYLKMKTDTGKSQFNSLIRSFVDTTKRYARISVGIEDIGSVRLPKLLDSVRQQADQIFNPKRYTVTFTGTSIVFLEGSKFIINSLRDSLVLALLMIIVCMIFLFHSWRIVVISIITNMIPLIITAGIMGFAGIPLKPSTVLVFSIALGIAIDVTIRFLVNYKQDLAANQFAPEPTVKATIQETGISIIYTSLILAAGFIVFLVSQFDGTKALGYLTALTLFLAMITNLSILPAMLVKFDKPSKK